MRNSKRIKILLDLIQKVWKKDPDLRLCQLIGNCFDSGIDLYNKEDDELIERIKKTYNV